MSHSGKEAVRTKIVLRNKPLEQMSHFHQLGCNITSKHDRDHIDKINVTSLKYEAVYEVLAKKFRKNLDSKCDQY